MSGFTSQVSEVKYQVCSKLILKQAQSEMPDKDIADAKLKMEI
jgi:hypothetical protein